MMIISERDAKDPLHVSSLRSEREMIMTIDIMSVMIATREMIRVASFHLSYTVL